MSRVVSRFVLTALLALAITAQGRQVSAAGVSSLRFSFEVIADGEPAGAVNANGARLMSIRGTGWASATTAKHASSSLNAAAVEGVAPEAIRVSKVKGGYAIFVGDRRILLVDRAIAAAMNSSREGLAELWAARVRAAFAAPYAAAPMDSQIVPFGERRVVPLRGNWKQVQVIADPEIVQAECDEVARTVSLLGLSAGETQIVVRAGRSSFVLPVRVMKYAGRAPSRARALVTGRTAPEWAMERAAAAATYYSVLTEPGARAEIVKITCDRLALRPGECATVTAVVSIRGETYLPVRAEVQAVVTNEPIAPLEAKTLMVSNRPERLPSHGVWYEGRVPSGYPARLLYHHVNATGADAELAVELVNLADYPVQVQIVDASGGPSRDEIFAGHKAARDFLRRQADDIGYVVWVPPGCAYRASAQRVKPAHVVSGIAEVRVLGKGDLRARVRLRSPGSDLIAPAIPLPSERASTWVFSEPHKRLQAEYRVGEHWAFATVGDKQVLSSTGRELLDGDFGVFYDVVFEVENSTPEAAEVELAVMPGGGLARGIVMIAGTIHESRMLRYGETERLYAFTVPSGARRELHVRTMPQAGSNYPIKLVMRPKGVWD